MMCKIFRVNRSCYHKWSSNSCCISKVDDELNSLIKEIFNNSYQIYGTRGIKETLLQEYGVVLSRQKIGTIMRNIGA
jgi:hypothetical protein